MNDELKNRIEALEIRLSKFEKSDRFIFQKLIQLLDGRNIQLGLTTGTKIGTATTQKLGLYGKTPTAQQSAISAPSISVVSGSGADTVINANFSQLQTAVNSLRTALSTIGITA
jgi:hypothetical protein